MEREYTVGPSQTADTAYSLFGGLPRNMLASSATGGASPVSPSWVISALRAALRRLRSETRLRAQARTPPSPARGMQHPQRDRAADGCPTLYNQFLKGQQLLSCAKRAAATRISLFAYLWQLLFVQSYLNDIASKESISNYCVLFLLILFYNISSPVGDYSPAFCFVLYSTMAFLRISMARSSLSLSRT